MKKCSSVRLSSKLLKIWMSGIHFLPFSTAFYAIHMEAQGDGRSDLRQPRFGESPIFYTAAEYRIVK